LLAVENRGATMKNVQLNYKILMNIRVFAMPYIKGKLA